MIWVQLFGNSILGLSVIEIKEWGEETVLLALELMGKRRVEKSGAWVSVCLFMTKTKQNKTPFLPPQKTPQTKPNILMRWKYIYLSCKWSPEISSPWVIKPIQEDIRDPDSFHSLFPGCEPVLISQHSCYSASIHIVSQAIRWEKWKKRECLPHFFKKRGFLEVSYHLYLDLIDQNVVKSTCSCKGGVECTLLSGWQYCWWETMIPLLKKRMMHIRS